MGIDSGLLSIRIFLANFTVKNGQKKIFVIHSVLKTNLWTYKIKDQNWRKIMGSFYKK